MRILTIIDHLGPGGRQRTAQNYSFGYASAGHDAAVLTVLGGGPRVERLVESGVDVFIGSMDPSERDDAITAAAAWQPEIVHLHSNGPPRPVIARAVEALLAHLSHRPPVLETSSFGKVDHQQRYTCTDVHLLKARWALWKWRQWTRSQNPRPLGVVVPNTTDTKAFHPVSPAERAAFRTMHGIPTDAFLLGRVGQPSVWKWSPVLLDAFAAVADRHPRTHLLLVGLPAELGPHLAALNESVRSRVTEIPFLHGDDALRACYGALDVFVHAAQIGESFGMVLTEAMACECPVLTLSTPARDNSQLEVVGHERGGLVVHNTAGMIAGIERLLNDEALRTRLGQAGAAYVRSTYTLDQVTPTLLRIIDLTRTATSRNDLARALAADPHLVTEVSDDEIEALLRNAIGHIPRSQRVLMRLVHVPLLFRMWWMLKGLRFHREEVTLPPDLTPRSRTNDFLSPSE